MAAERSCLAAALAALAEAPVPADADSSAALGKLAAATSEFLANAVKDEREWVNMEGVCRQ